MKLPVGRLLWLSSTITLVLCFAVLCGGCPDESTQQTIAAGNIQDANALVAKWRQQALQLPDTDSRKATFLNAIADVDNAAHRVASVSTGAAIAKAQPAPTDELAPLASVVPWGSSALLAAGVIYKGIQSFQRGSALQSANAGLQKAIETANSIAFALDAHNVAEPNKAVDTLHPEAVAQLTPDAVKLLNEQTITLNTIPPKP